MADKRSQPEVKGDEEEEEKKAAIEKARQRLRDLCDCDKVIEDEEEAAQGQIFVVDEDLSSGDEVDEILEAEYHRLNDALDLPADTYSLTLITANLPTSVNYGVRSGLTHHRMLKFSPLSRGHQGAAIAIAAYATTGLVKARCWNERIIDQVIEDGDTYYCESYDRHHIDDRKHLSVLDLKDNLVVGRTHRVHVKVQEAAYAGTFRSQNPTNLHLVKALELFFDRWKAGVLVSPVLNMAIWRDSRYFKIFDGQARAEDLLPVEEDSGTGVAKLILVRDLTGVLFVILEKSRVENENFVIYGVELRGVEKLMEDDPVLPDPVGKLKVRPSGYKIQDKFRALIRGSFHLTHPLIPQEFQARSHLVIALAALIYSRLIPANKWTTAMLDLIFNQAHIYLVDLVRVLEKKLDESLELRVEDVVGDVILGVYSAKVNVRINVVPGQGKKGKATMESGLKDFFSSNDLGILEIKKTFYAVWKDSGKYYYLDPFGCDEEGFRVDPDDPENAARLLKSVACVTMNSGIDQVVETVLENTGNKEKDPFIIHGLGVLYVRSGVSPHDPDGTVVYREKKTNRRPQDIPAPKPEEPDDCKILLDMIPRPRPDAETVKDAFSQYPELMQRVEEYMMRHDEPSTFLEQTIEGDAESKSSPDSLEAPNGPGDDPVDEEHVETEEKMHQVHFLDDEPELEEPDVQTSASDEIPPTDSTDTQEKIKFIKGYCIVNPHRLILHGSDNCVSQEFAENSRGRQGLALALTAISYSKIKDPWIWRNVDVDQIIRVGNQAHEDIVNWIRQGSPAEPDQADGDREDQGETEDEEEDDDEEAEEEEDEEANEGEGGKASTRSFKGTLGPVPSYIAVGMLPGHLKLAENRVSFLKGPSVIDGDADPLANLGEALERYFRSSVDVILENKRLMYGIWRQDGKYFLLNPYGSDEEGSRCKDYPASLTVVDTINELVDLLHSVLEFNERKFSLHRITIQSIQPGDKYVSLVPVEILESENVEEFKTKFLPITDDDLFVPEVEPEIEAPLEDENPAEATQEDDDEDEDEEDEEEDAEEQAEDEGESLDQSDDIEAGLRKLPEVEIPLEDPLLEIEEPEFPDAPDRLNLSLLTGSVRLEEEVVPDDALLETVLYERLKFSHPPPYVLPPKKVLCVLLEAKKASGSMHSLISRFSIDSKLAVKAATDLPTGKPTEPIIATLISSADKEKTSKIIKLPPTKYFFSRIRTMGFTPLRAINEKFIQDEILDKAKEGECRRQKAAIPEKYVMREVPEDPLGIRITPELIPLGPTIKTPTPRKKPKPCGQTTVNRKCNVSQEEKDDAVLNKVLCATEDVLFDMIFPGRTRDEDVNEDMSRDKPDSLETEEVLEATGHSMKLYNSEVTLKSTGSEVRGFYETSDDKIGIIEGNTALDGRDLSEECCFKQCFFAAILAILGKIGMDVEDFHGSVLDGFVLMAEKMYRRTGKLRYKPYRVFRNLVASGAKFDVILRQIFYADPENCDLDDLGKKLADYLEDYEETGILVFENASYAFWRSFDKYYVFDPYGCDSDGRAKADGGFSCLLEFCRFSDMIGRIRENNATIDKNSPYRVYSLSIAHVEPLDDRKHRKRRGKKCESKSEDTMSESREPKEERSASLLMTEVESSLLELPEWIGKKDEIKSFDLTVPGFAAIGNFEASAMEVPVLENDITRPIRPPIIQVKEGSKTQFNTEPARKKPYDRKFKDETCLNEPLDFCIIAWSCIADPALWGVRTIRAIFEACQDLTFDSLLVARDTSPTDPMTDGVLTDFSIGNYGFRGVTAPLHRGKLYALEGWNLAMSLKKIFEQPIYSGAVLVCDKAHIGLLKKSESYYAWWCVRNTKNLRIVTSRVMEDFLKLLVREIGSPEEKDFAIRILTISYARKLDPDCSEIRGLHETAEPSASIPRINRKKSAMPYDLAAIFRSTLPSDKPIFVEGSVGLSDRHTLTEPHVKRCYFVGLIAVMIKRDIVQSPMPAMIDRILEVADQLYRDFAAPKYHTEHVLRNVTLMNRIFDFRDVASSLYPVKTDPTGSSNFQEIVKKELRKYLARHSHGIIHFTNCCYGFWYCRATNAYYYVDPYRSCAAKSRKNGPRRNARLWICSTICQLTRQWHADRYEDTTGFFIHRLHVESVNVPPIDKFREDPMWVYLDYQWSFEKSSISSCRSTETKGRKKRANGDDFCREPEVQEAKATWNNYVIDVPNMLYSVWGTLGAHDARFGDRAGKNRHAICIAILSMQYLCHPSRWGAAILDSAVICGDSYYTESRKTKNSGPYRADNPFNLRTSFKVFPHIWRIDFLEATCGVLYGRKGCPDLATSLTIAFQTSPNVVLECQEVSIAVLSVDDGFYLVDPCWTGLPLFPKNRGAIYGLRCRNMHCLVYAATKILNTNQRLEFRITPISLTFSQEICRRTDVKSAPKRKILDEPFSDSPGIADGPDVPVYGAIVHTDRHSLPSYRQKLRSAILPKNRPIGEATITAVPGRCAAENRSVSTAWHLNVGRSAPKNRQKNPSTRRPLENHLTLTDDRVTLCDPYPRTIDFLTDIRKIGKKSAKISTGSASKTSPEVANSKPLDCRKPTKFLTSSSRREFERWNKDMADDAYKMADHRKPEVTMEPPSVSNEDDLPEEENSPENTDPNPDETEPEENEQ